MACLMEIAHPHEVNNMRELHHRDGRPFSFDRSTVRYFEPHQSGEGTLMRFDPIASPGEVHVQEDYAAVSEMVMASDTSLAAKAFLAGKADNSPF